ncbi:hypothetical protein NLU66_16500 [Brachybacterium sp. NBEC-018]|uniref:hypothetical protein n=1 Tax=Brachybacterium sp. NBEC-018 TaxID=2996004 RepID=UPI002174F5E2|nr:hypothetical protein [Brachybacterium sp. NBEC-018]UVY83788.1 hypothetical protein NLU66_16500 [Brachybacterium sp. NBEC-018]
MTWQKRVDVGDDLTRLHRSSRAADMSRDIGYSSVSMGEGSLDFIVGDDAENTRVVLGDQADGRFGIGLWHRGGMKYLPDVLEDAEDRITGTEEKNADQDTVIDTKASKVYVDNTRDALQADIDTKASKTYVDNADGALSGRLDGYGSRLGDAEAELGTKASKAYVDNANAAQDTAIDSKASKAYVDNKNDSQDEAINSKASKTYVDNANASQDEAIATKATAVALAAAVSRISDLEDTRPTKAYVDNLNAAMRIWVKTWVADAQQSVPGLPNIPD